MVKFNVAMIPIKLGCTIDKPQDGSSPDSQGDCCSCVMSRLRPNGPGPTYLQSETLQGRQRVTLAPGHSLMDWIRLGRDKGDLSGGKMKEVSMQELSQHNTESDLWMAVKGKVYNITPYLDFHPGGISELMRAAGDDGTELFEEIHSWVNVESMLSKCLVGPLVAGEFTSTKKRLSLASNFLSPPAPVNEAPTPVYDWYQTPGEVKVVIYVRNARVSENKVVVDVNSQEVMIEVYVKEHTYFVNFRPFDKLEETCTVTSTQISANSNAVNAHKSYAATKDKLEVTFKKKKEENWTSLGTPLKMDKTFVKTKSAEPRFWQWTVVSNSVVTHDTKLIALKGPPGTTLSVPMGYHFIIHHVVEGMELARSYTVVLPSLLKEKCNSVDKALVYLMIKSYPGGAISPWITSIKPGSKVKMNRFDGCFKAESLDSITHLYMFAAGTGFTSMIRPIYHVLHERSSTSPLSITLVFYNKTVDDILWKDQLDQLAKTHKNFSVFHSLSGQPPANWTGLTGRVNKNQFEKYVKSPSPTVKPLLLICGQFAFNDSVDNIAKAHGYKPEHIHVFSSTS